MAKFKILSYNARGLGSNLKCRKVFHFMNRQKVDILLLQEVHSVSHTNQLWGSEFGGEAIFANGTSNSRGVAILFKKKIGKIDDIYRDINGRYVIIKVTIDDYSYCLANIYAPNSDDPEFFRNVFGIINQIESVFTIVGGDYNLVLNSSLDWNKESSYNPKAWDTLLTLMEEHNLVDIWRARFPNDKKFTWCKYDSTHRNFRWSCIDYFLVSESMMNGIVKCGIQPGVFSDHSIISLDVEVEKSKRGPGYWKCNDEQLNDRKFCTYVESELKWVLNMFSYLGRSEKWEMLKFEAGNICKEQACLKRNKDKTKEFELYQLLDKMQSKLVSSNITTETAGKLNTNIEIVQHELNSFEEQRTRRAMFQCKQNWYEKGLKPTRYFFNLEKQNYLKKFMYMVRRKDGSLTKDYTEILNIQHDYYKRLYSADPNVKFDKVNTMDMKLSQQRRLQFECFVTKDKLYDGLVTLKSGKCPGLDGLSLEFYKKFWKVLIDPLYDMLCESYEKGTLSYLARRGVINLIPKKLDSTWIHQWRPIMILNYDYRIFAKALANRLDTSMDELVGKEQNGFIRGRSIMSNLTLTREILAYLNRKKQPGIVAIVDYSKCFDRIAYPSVRGMLRYLNYGDNFIRMIFLLFTQFQACTINNGNISNFFVKEKGVNQGCPASPGLYIQTSTLLSHLITGDSNVKGIALNNLQRILYQFADNTSAFLSYDPLTLEGFCNALNQIEQQLGLVVSYDKTTLYRVGSLQNSNAKIYTSKPLKWSNGPIETLGVKFNADGTAHSSALEKIHVKLDAIITRWSKKRIPLVGKVLVINTLIASLFVYNMSVMTNLTNSDITKIEKKIHAFLWDGKSRGRIAMRTLHGKIEDGGLRLANLFAKQEALEIHMVFCCHDTLLDYLYHEIGVRTLGCTLWKCNLSPEDCEKMFGSGTYWTQTLKAWCRINYCWPQSKNQILNQIIWLNSEYRQNNRPIYWPKWIEAGVLFIQDMLNPYGEFLTWDTFKQKYAGLSWLDYTSLCHAFPPMWKIRVKGALPSEDQVFLYDQLKLKPKISRVVYDRLIDNYQALLKYAQSWRESAFPNLDYDLYHQSFKNLHIGIKNPKLRDFQYRLLLNKLVFNQDLNQWGMKQQEVCMFCEQVPECATHIFFHCSKV